MTSVLVSCGAIFTRFPYLPRLIRREVLDDAVQQAMTSVLTGDERFGIAAAKDPETGRYLGLVIPPDANRTIQVTDRTLLVQWDKAQQQAAAEARGVNVSVPAATMELRGGQHHVAAVHAVHSPSGDVEATATPESEKTTRPVRFFGSTDLDPQRYARDFGNISREIIDHLLQSGIQLEVSIEIKATKPEGFTESEVRTIRENATTLKFDDAGFESDVY